jgi:hypothetical protein
MRGRSGEVALQFWIELPSLNFERLQHDLPGLVMKNTHVLRILRRRVFGPRNLSRQYVLRTLEPFEANERCRTQMGLTNLPQGTRHKLQCVSPRPWFDCCGS